MDYKNNFSIRLLECRKTAALSQKALANIIGVSDAAVTMMEKGKRAPSFEILCSLADYFNVSLDYLCGRSDIKKRGENMDKDKIIHDLALIYAQAKFKEFMKIIPPKSRRFPADINELKNFYETGVTFFSEHHPFDEADED